MVFSQNGWAAAATKPLAAVDSVTVPGTAVTLPGGLRRGDASVVLLYVAAQMHQRVEPGVPGWCWGWNYRAVRGASALSNHASGTAFDWNAPRHPLAKRGTWTPAQRQVMLDIAREVDGVIRYGWQYEKRADDMHVELVGSPAAVGRVADRLRGHPVLQAAPVPAAPAGAILPVGGAQHDGTLRQGAKGADVVGWQGELWRLGYGVGAHDGQFGPATEGATLDLQRAAGPTVADDGVVGNGTRDAARLLPTYPKSPGPDLPLCGPGWDGPTVGAFQDRLRQRGWSISVDSRYGPGTRNVVARFQADANARGFHVGTVDGIGGPATWTALHAAPVTP